MIKNYSVGKFYFPVFLIFMLFGQVHGQGIIIKGSKEDVPMPSQFEKMDAARYHKIQMIDVKFGQFYSNDRGFQRFMKDYGFAPGSQNFIDIGANYHYLVKKVNVGGRVDFAFQNNSMKPALWHISWQGTVGYALFRKQNTIFTINSNIGVQTSTIRFGSDPPDFLDDLGYPDEDCKLFQKQFIAGPSLNFNKIFNKTRIDKGFSIGIEAGVNFAPFKPVWKYGYTNNDSEFVGEKINNMPHASKQSYFTTIKIGFWNAL